MDHNRYLHLTRTCLVIAGMVVFLLSCATKKEVAAPAPIPHEHVGEHSPSVFIVMYDRETGKEPLLQAIKDYKCEAIYDYSIIPGMAIKKPDGKTLDETMRYFKGIKGVVSVEYDRVYHLDDPVKPKLETE